MSLVVNDGFVLDKSIKPGNLFELMQRLEKFSHDAQERVDVVTALFIARQILIAFDSITLDRAESEELKEGKITPWAYGSKQAVDRIYEQLNDAKRLDAECHFVSSVVLIPNHRMNKVFGRLFTYVEDIRTMFFGKPWVKSYEYDGRTDDLEGVSEKDHAARGLIWREMLKKPSWKECGLVYELTTPRPHMVRDLVLEFCIKTDPLVRAHEFARNDFLMEEAEKLPPEEKTVDKLWSLMGDKANRELILEKAKEIATRLLPVSRESLFPAIPEADTPAVQEDKTSSVDKLSELLSMQSSDGETPDEVPSPEISE